MRVKTIWFKQQGTRSPKEIATVGSSAIWRMAETTVDSLSRADFDIITPVRGFGIMAEMIAFLLHFADRLVHGRVSDEWRQEFLQSSGQRLAELINDNVHRVVGEDGHDHRPDFIARLNRRAEDYANFDFPDGEPSFPALRYLGHAIQEVMSVDDQHWIVGQIMEVEAAKAIDTVRRQINGLLDPQPAARPAVPRGE